MLPIILWGGLTVKARVAWRMQEELARSIHVYDLFEVQFRQADLAFVASTSRLQVQSDPVTTAPLIPSRDVIMTWTPSYGCTSISCQNRACPQKVCRCRLDVTVSKVTITRSDCTTLEGSSLSQMHCSTRFQTCAQGF